MNIVLEFKGEPVRWSSPHIKTRSRYESPPHIAWIEAMRIQIPHQLPDDHVPWNGAVSIVRLEIRRTRPKSNYSEYPITPPDIGNLEKPIEDALQGFVYTNDARIVHKGNVDKIWALGDKEPGVTIEVEPR